MDQVGCILMDCSHLCMLEHVCLINTNSMGLNVDGYLMGLIIQNYSMDDMVIICKKSSIASIHMKLQT